MIIATFIMAGVKINYQLSKSEIEKKARGIGMDYPSEFRVINEGKK